MICEDHSPEIRIAQGSGNIYINSQPAARKDDHTECDAVIEDGSPNVFFGGGTQTVLEISPEIPDWLRQVVDVLYVVAGMLGGLAGASRQATKMGSKFGTKCAAKFIGGEIAGMGISEAAMGLFSNPVDVTTGQKFCCRKRISPCRAACLLPVRAFMPAIWKLRGYWAKDGG